MASNQADDPDPVSEKKMDPDIKHRNNDLKLFFMIKVLVINDESYKKARSLNLLSFLYYKVKLYITLLKYNKYIISSGKRKG